MASIKATIKLETTTLFPVPVGFTVPVVETVNLDAAFSTVAVQQSATETVYGATTGTIGTSGIVYFYAQAASTNTANIIINIRDTALANSQALRLAPGDFAWFPLNATGAGVQVSFTNTSVSAENTVYYFYGEKG